MSKGKVYWTLTCILISVIYLASVLYSCGKQGPKGPALKVKMGGLIPLSGPLAEFGDAFINGGDLAVEQFTKAGFRIEMKYEDTKTFPKSGSEAAKNLVQKENIQVLIGAASSGVSLNVATTVSIPSQILQISYASTSPLISFLYDDTNKDFLFRTCPSDALQGIILGKLAYDEGYRKAVVFWIKNAYGQGLKDRFKEAFEYRGGNVVADVSHDEKPALTYKSELKRLLKTNPDVILVFAYPEQATVYLKEFFETGINKKGKKIDILFCDGTKSIKMPKALGAKNLAGFKGTAPGSVAGKSLSQFEKDYKAKYGELPPLPFIANYYDAVFAAGLAAIAAETKGKELTSINIRDQLRYVSNPPGKVISAGVEQLKKAITLLKEGKDINYEGAASTVDFDANGDINTPIEIWQYTENEPYIKTVKKETEIPAK